MNYKNTFQSALSMAALLALFSCSKQDEWVPGGPEVKLIRETNSQEISLDNKSYNNGGYTPTYQLQTDLSRYPKPKLDPDPDPWNRIAKNRQP